MALALGDVGAVDGEDGQRRDEQHRHGARVGGDDERGGDRDARVDQRDQRVHGEHLAQHRRRRCRPRRSRSRRRCRTIVSAPLAQRRGVQADPGRGLERVGVAGDQRAAIADGDADGERELGEVEGELDRRQPADSAVDDAGADQRAEHEVVAARRTRGRTRTAGRRARTSARCGGSATWTTQISAHDEAERDRPPRAGAASACGAPSVGEERPATAASDGERDDVDPHEDLARHVRAAAHVARRNVHSSPSRQRRRKLESNRRPRFRPTA